MDEKPGISVSPLLLFALVTALFAAGTVYFVHRTVRDALLNRHEERGARHLQDIQTRIRARIDSLLGRIQGAELLMAAVPGVADKEGKALSFLLGGESRESFAASILLDERGRIRDSRRVGSMPPPGDEEKGLWSGARRSLLSLLKREGGPRRRKFDVQSSTLNDAPIALLLAPSSSTKGFWGVIVPAESLLPLKETELTPGESVFLLTEPEQKVLFARQGEKFLAESIAGAYKTELASALDVKVCCDPAAFNTGNRGKRSMSQSTFYLGMRRLRLVRLAQGSTRTGTGLTMLAGVMATFWLVSLALFYLLKTPGEGSPAVWVNRSGLDGEIFGKGLPTERAAVIMRMSESVAEGVHFRKVIVNLVREVSRFLSTDRYYAALYDDATDRFLEVCHSRLGEGYRRAVTSPDSGLPERIAIREKEIVEVPCADEWHGAPEVLRSEKIGGAVVFPLVALGKVVGLASFYFDVPRERTEDEVDYCAILLQQAAVAISRALAASAQDVPARTRPARSSGDVA